jgi:hypothetical protein
VAGEIEGFDRLVFRKRAQMHEALDWLSDDPQARRHLSAAARSCILQHDTYDSLVRRIIDHFCNLQS